LRNNKLLLIGPYPHSDPGHVGGATILFKTFVEYLNSTGEHFSIISICRYKGFGQHLKNYFYVLLNVLLRLPFSETVILNFSRRSLFYLAPVCLCYAYIWKVKIALRIFGDHTVKATNSSNPFYRIVSRWIISKVDILFVETKSQVRHCRRYNTNTWWFPNCRNYTTHFILREYRRRFVFISHVKINKGIQLIMDVFNSLDSTYTLDVYGPVRDIEMEYITKHNSYKGIVSSEDVYRTLDEYDVLLLPTFYAGEGYPGIIIEAYAMSIPVITTRWNAIPEMVSDGDSGIIIQPESFDALKEAITHLDASTYERLNRGAYEMSMFFRSDKIHRKIMDIIHKSIANDYLASTRIE
jgi:glycosyltransferase involved in cell wall biosynthesis